MRKGQQARRPRSPSEADCFDFLKEMGWQPTKRGWPDFAAFNKDGDFIVVEVKSRGSESLLKSQKKIMIALMQHGIKCYRFAPDTGFLKISLDEKGKADAGS